jgi:1,4-dihydroxy-6-naphthoate synthase
MFYALATRKIRSPLVTIKHQLADIETLNRQAMAGVYELTAISYHAYPYVASKYVLMASGSSIGDGYGPMLIATRPMSADQIKGKRIAVPGRLTTAFLALSLMEPDFIAVPTPFEKIPEAVRNRDVDIGLIIHEAQLTYSKGGYSLIADLGKWWKQKYRLPLPLGANALRRDLPSEIQRECCRLMRESIQFALDHKTEALQYAMQFARDMEEPLAEKFVGMYVNHHTLDCGEDVPKAAQMLLDLGHEAGLIPHRVQVEFVR